MKAVLVIDMPDDLDIPLEEIKANITVSSKDVRKSMLYLKYKDCQLRPLPKRHCYEIGNDGLPTDIEHAVYCNGRNKVIDEITGETE